MIIFLMNKTVIFYWFIIFLNCMCYLTNVFSEEPVPVHLNFKGKYTSDITNYEIVVPQRVNKDGSFISHLVSHHHSKRSTKELEFIFYKIPIGGKDYLIELTPNRKLISPGAVVEIHKEDVKKSVNRKFLNESANNERIEKMFKNLDIRKLENTECHFSGHVKGENISKAALSTCYGLAGFIQIRKGFYTIEPVAEHNPFVEDAYPHILYKTDGLENSSVCHTMGALTASLVDQVVRKRRESNFGLSLPIYIETLIVMDKTLINHHKDSDCENYVLTVFNMAFNLFHDASSGLMMTLTIVRIIRLEVENDEMNLKVNADAEKTLRYFQTWQYEINPGDDSHPNHHDIAVLITRVNVCYSPTSCGLLGLTTIGKGCDSKLSAALCEDNGLRLGYVIAHEIGHLLGADHDFDNSTCNGTDADGLKTVMHPHVSLTSQTWSACSQAYFKAFFGSGMGSCFLDEPEEHHFNVQDLLPGVMYSADFQCKHLITTNARECDMGSTCDSLNCYVPGYACIVTHKQPADGTRCGENMWCHDSKCLVVGERPGAVDGNWGEWSAWSDCSRTCGSGVASSVRNCDKPQPSHGGRNCIGERKRYKICAASITAVPQHISDLLRFISEEVNVSFVGKPCETGRPSFRDIQCGEFDDWIYPEDGKIHTWKAYFYHNDNPCTLYCINEEKQVAALRPRVVDGTMCFRGIRDICIGGICKSLPCDLHFESNAVEDACGICHGDGTGCEFSEGTETFSKFTKGLTKLVNVPTGTRNIKVEELSPTSAKIIVRDKDTRDVYVQGKSLGMFNVPGSQAWLGMIKKNQKALNIPGPITKPLSIWIKRLDNVTVKWSMALPVDQQRKPEFAWDYLKWGPCSANCGPGTQKSEPSCMEEKAGLVEDSFCADLEMPPIKVRQCEVAKCETRWMVGDWKGCERPTSQKKERKRVVYCIKSIGEGEGESQIVSDSECTDSKPHDSESCENRKKRENTEFDTDDGFFEPDIMFKSDTSEFGFHKKYEDYLKHFAALSVPQRNSETIPLYLVSSPHFKHYFHVLETPEDSETDSGSNGDVNLPSGTSYDAQAQKKVSPDFYKETFSGQQIGVSHVQSVFQRGSSALENRTKKSVTLDFMQRQRANSIPTFNVGLKKLRIKSKLAQHENSIKNHSNCRAEKKRTQFTKNFHYSIRGIRNVKFKFFSGKECKKNFNYTSLNFTSLIENLSEKDKSCYASLIGKSKAGEPLQLERTKLKSYHWNAHSPKSLSHKLSSFFSLFSKNKTRSDEKFKSSRQNAIRKLVKLENKDFDGSGARRSSAPDDESRENAKFNDIQKPMKQERSFFANPFDPMRTGKFDPRSKKGFRALEDLLLRKNNRFYGKKIFNKRTAQPRTKLKRSRLDKRKRSSRIWKKPKSKDTNSKSGKEQCGNLCGSETRNYLNNLFRDNHPKMFTPKPTPVSKPQETKDKYKNPVIKEGVLVIDKDLAENQEIEIVFEDDEEGKEGNKYLKLPQPTKNGRKLTLKGQDVFNFLQELQRRSAREAFYRGSNNSNENEEINIEVAEKKAEIKNTTANPSTSENTKKSNKTNLTSISTTSNKIDTVKEESKLTESTTKPLQADNVTTSSSGQSPTTVSETLATTQKTSTTVANTEAGSDGCEYDIDEMAVENLNSTTEGTAKSKKKKKKKKKEKPTSKDICGDFPCNETLEEKAELFAATKGIQKYGRRKRKRWYYGKL